MKNNGFSLIELLVVMSIIATFSVALILNFRVSSTNTSARQQAASVIVSDIRRAQTMALAGSRFGGNTICGYGIHYINSSSYLIYAGADEGLPMCSNTNHNYQAGVDFLVETKIIQNINMEIRSSFADIFFEPPDPRVYLNNNSSLAIPPVTITIQVKGQASCAVGTCTDIKIYTSGRLDVL